MGVEAQLREVERSTAPLDSKLTDFENKGAIEELRPEEIFSLIGETPASMAEIGERAQQAKEAAEEAAMIPFPVSLSVVNRIKELYAESKGPNLSPEEVLGIKNQIKATIQDSNLFGE